MTALSKAERAKLAKILASATADHPAEASDAVLLACKLIAARGLNWSQVLSPPVPDRPVPERGTWRKTVAQLAQAPTLLYSWEKTFLTDLPKFRRLSTKQRYCLKTIADRILGEGAR
jgi:hypothetical protein